MEYELTLCHHGTKGMRWGIRRYQNKDGSLTPAGKKRYDSELEKVRKQEKVNKTRQATRNKIEKLEARKKAADSKKNELDEAEGKNKKTGLFKQKKKAEETPKKSVKDMSDIELYEAINRARMEDTYNQLRPASVEKPKAFKKLIDDVVAPAATTAGRKFLEDALMKAGKELLKDKVDPDSLEALTKMRDKLKLKKEIEKLENGEPEAKRTWKDMKEELEYVKAKEKYDSDKAKAAAKADEEARKANEQRSLAEYEKSSGGYRYNYNIDRNSKEASDTNSSKTTLALPAPKNSTTKTSGQDVDASSRRKAGWERKASMIDNEIDWNAPSSSKSTDIVVSTGSKYIESSGNSNRSVAGLLSAPSTKQSSKSAEKYVSNQLLLLDRNPEPLMNYDENGKFIGYWSAIRGDSDGTF